MEITWSEPGDWIVEYAYNQTRYGDLNVSFFSDSILLEPGFSYFIRSTTANNNRIEDKDSFKSTGGDHNPISFTNITIILLMIAIPLVIFSLFIVANKRR